MRCENTRQWLYEGRSLKTSANIKPAQLHSSEIVASLGQTPHCSISLCERVIDGIMNRQKDAEGENASHGQSSNVTKACGKDKPHSSSIALSFCLLSEERRTLRMSSEMKGWLWNRTHIKEVKSGLSVQLVLWVVFYPSLEFTSWFASGHVILNTMFDI